MTRGEELAWAAGLADGEGSINANLDTDGVKIKFHFSVSNTDHAAVARFQQIVGGRGRVIVNHPRADNRRTVWAWLSNGREAKHVLQALRPWLCIKAPQADVLLGVPLGRPDGAPRSRLSPLEKIGQGVALMALRELNHA